jgi:hypothetical protein
VFQSLIQDTPLRVIGLSTGASLAQEQNRLCERVHDRYARRRELRLRVRVLLLLHFSVCIFCYRFCISLIVLRVIVSVSLIVLLFLYFSLVFCVSLFSWLGLG